jgi:hypothetical protein
MNETRALLDAVHHRLAPQLRGFGLELIERELSVDDAPSWLEYRCSDDGVWCLLSITAQPAGLILAEFWRPAIAGRQVDLLEHAEWWHAGEAETLLAALIGEIERWLETFAGHSAVVS